MEIAKRDRVFDSSSVHGVPPPVVEIANKQALEKRSRPKNPKIIVNPKHRATSTVSSKILAVTSTPAKQSGSIGLTAYSDNTSEFRPIFVRGEWSERGRRRRKRNEDERRS